MKKLEHLYRPIRLDDRNGMVDIINELVSMSEKKESPIQELQFTCYYTWEELDIAFDWDIPPLPYKVIRTISSIEDLIKAWEKLPLWKDNVAAIQALNNKWFTVVASILIDKKEEEKQETVTEILSNIAKEVKIRHWENGELLLDSEEVLSPKNKQKENDKWRSKKTRGRPKKSRK